MKAYQQMMTLSYGSTQMGGYTMTEKLCFSSSKCANNFLILGITSRGSFKGAAGLVGISPKSGKGENAETGVSFLQTLYD